MSLRFWKTQTIGNDFVLIHADEAPDDLAALAINACSRHFGIGADGLLVLSNDFTVRMFNPDGTEDFCGNGLRCAAKHFNENFSAPDEFSMTHLGLFVPTSVAGRSVTITLPPASFDSESVPTRPGTAEGEIVVADTKGWAVTTGSTHFIVLVDELPADALFAKNSEEISSDPIFPERTSVMWTKAIDNRTLKLRIYERGVGETLGCGTGSSAAAVVWSRVSGVSGQFKVINPGGDLLVSLDSWDGPISSTSEPRVSFQGTLC